MPKRFQLFNTFIVGRISIRNSVTGPRSIFKRPVRDFPSYTLGTFGKLQNRNKIQLTVRARSEETLLGGRGLRNKKRHMGKTESSLKSTRHCRIWVHFLPIHTKFEDAFSERALRIVKKETCFLINSLKLCNFYSISVNLISFSTYLTS
jgi:hypothetical protein